MFRSIVADLLEEKQLLLDVVQVVLALSPLRIADLVLSLTFSDQSSHVSLVIVYVILELLDVDFAAFLTLAQHIDKRKEFDLGLVVEFDDLVEELRLFQLFLDVWVLLKAHGDLTLEGAILTNSKETRMEDWTQEALTDESLVVTILLDYLSEQ